MLEQVRTSVLNVLIYWICVDGDISPSLFTFVYTVHSKEWRENNRSNYRQRFKQALSITLTRRRVFKQA